MGLKDRPLVDTSAENSSLSINALRDHFQEINGFIAREDIPDKGCDFLVEILESNRATNWRFPIQLKSIQNPVFIEEGKYISYSFELSRLGYLLEHKPVVGLIIFFAVAEGKLYFDYIDKIYFRLIDQCVDDHWKMQHTANIHIPVENVLTPSTRQQIHAFMVKMFSNHHEMYQDHAVEYRLPVIEPPAKKETSQSLIEKIMHDMRLYGMVLISQGQISLLNKLLSHLPNQDIISDHKIALIAAMTYRAIGLHVDTEYYLSKIISRKDLPEEDLFLAQWTKTQNDYKLNKIDSKEFIQQLTQLRLKISTDAKGNLLMVDLILVQHQILELSPFSPLPTSILTNIYKYKEEIDALEETSFRKNQLQLMNVENYSLLIIKMFDFSLGIFKRDKLAGRINLLLQRTMWAQYLSEHEIKFISINYSIQEKARNDKNIYLQGETLALFCHNSLSIIFLLLRAPGRHRVVTRNNNKQLFAQKIKVDIGMAINAIMLFEEGAFLDRAYQCFCMALELLHIAKHFELDIEENIEELNQARLRLQADIQAPDYEFQAFDIIGNFA